MLRLSLEQLDQHLGAEAASDVAPVGHTADR